MSRPTVAKDSKKLPKIILADETERLEYLAALLLEIAEEELAKGDGALCNQN